MIMVMDKTRPTTHTFQGSTIRCCHKHSDSRLQALFALTRSCLDDPSKKCFMLRGSKIQNTRACYNCKRSNRQIFSLKKSSLWLELDMWICRKTSCVQNPLYTYSVFSGEVLSKKDFTCFQNLLCCSLLL